MSFKESSERTRTAEAMIAFSQSSTIHDNARKPLHIVAPTPAPESLDPLQEKFSRLEIQAASSLLKMKLNMYRPSEWVTREILSASSSENESEAEKDHSVPQDTVNDSENDKEDQDQAGHIAAHVQGPFQMHRKRDCRARCRNECNGKRKIKANIQKGLAPNATISVCEPTCRDAKPACQEGCDFVRQYNTQVLRRNASRQRLAKFKALERTITNLRASEQRVGAANVLIRRAESKIKALE